jgi:hypothetical protein
LVGQVNKLENVWNGAFVTQLMVTFPKLPGETVEHRENLPSELEISVFKFASVICQVKVRGLPMKHVYAYLYISLTVHHDINQFVITNLMHICFIS